MSINNYVRVLWYAVTCCDYAFIPLSVSSTLRHSTAHLFPLILSSFVQLHCIAFAGLHTRQPGSVGLPECAWLCQQPADIWRDLKISEEMWRTRTSKAKHTMNSRNARQTPGNHSAEMNTRQPDSTSLRFLDAPAVAPGGLERNYTTIDPRQWVDSRSLLRNTIKYMRKH